MNLRVRFAPSPTGFLHVGNVRTALFNWLLARQAGGTFVLRVEDTDPARSEQRFEDQLIEDLTWLGLDWSEGVRRGGPHGPYRQSERSGLYSNCAGRLLSEEKAYYCFCAAETLEADRQRQIEAGQPVHYVGRCRSLDPDDSAARAEAGEPATVRFKVRPGRVGFDDLVFGPVGVDASTIGDFVLLRSDGSAQYNFACVVDDALMQITHVVRGEGHISNTQRQLLVFEALGITPPRFAHLSTILGPDGSKLSKRHGATSIAEFRTQGYLPEALLNYLSLLGWSPSEGKGEILSPAEIIEDFDLGRVQTSPATFDPDKLNWVNRSHLKAGDPHRVEALALPSLREAGFVPEERTFQSEGWLQETIQLLARYVDRGSDFGPTACRVFGFDPEAALSDPEIRELLGQEQAVRVIRTFLQVLTERNPAILDSDSYREIVLETKKRTGAKGKALFHPVRVALTGQGSGPELDQLAALLDRGSHLNLPANIISVRERVSAIVEHVNRGAVTPK